MKNMLDSYVKEMKYQYYSKVVIIFVVSIIISGIFFMVTNILRLNYHYNMFIRTYEYEESNGENIEELLKEEYSYNTYIDDEENTIEEITNPLRFDYENLLHSIHLITPTQSIIQVIEFLTLILIPIASTIFALYISTYDYKYKTVKVVSVNNNWTKKCFSKLISLFTTNIISISSSVIVTFIVANILYIKTAKNIPISDFEIPQYYSNVNLIVKISIAYLCSIIFSCIGLIMGMLFKRMIIPIILFFIYYTCIPMMGKYDFKNIIYNLSNKVFDFYGSIGIPNYIEISVTICILYVIGIILSSIIAIILISKKQSKYV